MLFVKGRFFSGIFSLACLATVHVASAQTEGQFCGTDLVNARYAEEHPERLAYREQMRGLIRESVAQGIVGNRNTVVIPTVVHIMHRDGPENISNEQVEDAMRVLNEDLRRINSDSANTRPLFKPYAADFNVEFRLAKLDPSGNCTNGITRHYSELTNAADDNIKRTSRGGTDAWPVNRYFNIWVVGNINLGQSGVIGYAYFPSWGISGNYGVVIDNNHFGTIGSAPTADGRTLTHEVGHCLELYHTFQSGCGLDCSSSGDEVCDTPPVSAATFTCSYSLNSCDNDAVGPSAYGTDVVDMIENYMSYNQGFCQNVFTKGQKERSDAVLQNTFLAQLITPQNLLATGTSDGFVNSSCQLAPDFQWSLSAVCEGDSVQFNDYTGNGTPSTWQWTITGPETLTATGSNPVVYFPNAGTYSVTLTVTDASGNASVSKNSIIRVNGTVAPQPDFFDGFDNQPLGSGRWLARNATFGNGWAEKTVGTGNNVMYINNTQNTRDEIQYELYSPSYNLTGINDPKLFFRMAYATKTGQSADRLSVYISRDCGVTWILRFSRTGNILANLPASAQPINPASSGDWALWGSDIPMGYEDAENLLVKFVFRTGGGNDLYIDDINLLPGASVSITEATQTAQLLISPNPTSDYFTMDLGAWDEKDLHFRIYDMGGRTVSDRRINGGSLLTFHAAREGLAPGMYRVSVQGKSGAVSGKIIVTE